MGRTTPTQRTLAKLREDGWEATVVERWVPIPHSPIGGVRRDLGGFGDVLAWRTALWSEEPVSGGGFAGFIHHLRPGGILAVQACSGSTLAAHRAKLRAEPRLRSWLLSGGRCEIWAWRKLAAIKKDGKKGKARRWSPLVEPVTLEHFSTGEAGAAPSNGNLTGPALASSPSIRGTE